MTTVLNFAQMIICLNNNYIKYVLNEMIRDIQGCAKDLVNLRLGETSAAYLHAYAQPVFTHSA